MGLWVLYEYIKYKNKFRANLKMILDYIIGRIYSVSNELGTGLAGLGLKWVYIMGLVGRF